MAEYTQEQRIQAINSLLSLKQIFDHGLHSSTFDSICAYRTALDTAIACLRSPIASPETDGKAGGWVRTSERMPTEEDEIKGYGRHFVIAIRMLSDAGKKFMVGVPIDEIERYPEIYPLWYEDFKLPEVEP